MNNAAIDIAKKCSVVTYACQITSVAPLSQNTFKVELQLPPGEILNYYAGQYLKLDLDVNSDGQVHSLFYSIANGFDPEQARSLEIFIQNTGELTEAILRHLFQLIENKSVAKVTLPMGQAYLQTDLGLTHLFIAAGSGISKIRCLTAEILRQQSDADVNIYWSNKNADEFYLLDEFQGWADKNTNLNFTPILESAHKDWLGRSGYLYELIERDFEDLDSAQAYLCGSPQMVYGTIDKLNATGLKEANCYSDVFEYAPRNRKIVSSISG